MRRWFIASLLALCAVALNAQGLETTTVAGLPTCVDGSPWMILVVDGDSSTDCSTGSSSTEVVCTCKDGTIAGLSTSGGGGNSFETMNVDNGTDPVADSSTDTLNWTSGTGITITGDSSTDTITIASTASPVALDLGDDGGGDSAGITELATIYDRYGIVTEPSADKALFDLAAIDDRYLAGPPSSAGTPDDEFDSGTLNGKWTAVGCTAGTADPYALSGSDFSTYDLSYRSGWLTIQVGDDTNDVCQFYQEYTIPDGSAVFIRVAHGGSLAGNTAQFDFGVNSSMTGPVVGSYLFTSLDAESAGVRTFSFGSSGADYLGATVTEIDAYFAIARIGLYYVTWVSTSGGTSWHVMKTMQFVSAPTHLWVGVRLATNYPASALIRLVHVDWVRLGNDDPYHPNW